MKKLFKILTALIVASVFVFTACQPDVKNNPETPAETTGEETGGSSGTNDSGSTTTTVDVYTIDAGTAATANNWYIAAISLQDFASKTVDVTFSADMKVVNSGDADKLDWTINGVDSDGTTAKYTSVAAKEFASGTTDWTTVTGSGSSITLGNYPVLYISTYGITPANFTIYVKNICVKVTVSGETTSTTLTAITTGTGITKTTETVTSSGDDSGDDDSDDSTTNWLSDDVPSLYETYKDQFDYIGIAAEYGNMGLTCSGNKYTGTYTQTSWGTPSELYYEEIQKGIAKHANSITLGNELKPQFVLAWWNTGDGANQTMTTFTASNGKTISVPNSLNNEKLIYATLNVAKKMGVQMRGHVLTWHSQTPDDFFAEGYSAEYTDSTKATLSNPVDEETMTARHEWYIKSVLECVANWEAANGYGTGNHLIWAWDVVNEATADNAGKTYTGTSQDWLRGSTSGTKDVAPGSGGSRWYQIYGDDEFIVNAFRFANAYAPSDVKLCYNDYNEYWDASGHYKTSAICHLVEEVQNGAAGTVNGASVKPRIDVVAMQSHVGTAWPGVSGYESALKRFLALGCDVHVSELDFSATTRDAAVTAYGDYFTMLQKYGKNYSGTNKVTNITIWGINDENSWINPSSSGKSKTYPLLFNLVDNVTTSTKTVTYDTGTETLPLYDSGDTYAPNDSFWAVINAHN